MISILILGGSSIYTAMLFDAIKKASLEKHIDRIALYGRNRLKLKYLTDLGTHLFGNQIAIKAIDQFNHCLEEKYDLVFNQIRIGGMETRNQDEKTALVHEMFADETLGIVGASNAIRTVNQMEPIFEAFGNLGHQFTFLNFTNPCSIVVQSAIQYMENKIVGICDYPVVFANTLANQFNLPTSEIELDYFGLNHLAYADSVKHHGKIIYQENSPLLTPDWEYIFQRSSRVKRQKEADKNRAQVLCYLENRVTDYMQQNIDNPSHPPMLKERNCDWYNLCIIPFIKQICNLDKSAITINIPAEDIFEQGWKDTVVEIPAKKTGNKFTPLITKDRPKHKHWELVTQLKHSEFELLKGIKNKSLDQIIHAVKLNPMIENNDDNIYMYFENICKSDPDFKNLLSD